MYKQLLLCVFFLVKNKGLSLWRKLAAHVVRITGKPHGLAVGIFICMITALPAWAANIDELAAKAQNGEARAQFELGLYYDENNDYTQALAWYGKAAEQGLAEAQYNLAVMYAGGLGLPQNSLKAFEWLTKAAKQNAAPAQYALGCLYANGEGVAQDFGLSIEWYTKAAEQGLVEAQHALGVMYETGEGTAQNYPLALKWYAKAAVQGSANDQFNLAQMYYMGLGTAPNPAKAAEWLTKAAEQNLPHAQYSLAAILMRHQDIAQGLSGAYIWLQKLGCNPMADAEQIAMLKSTLPMLEKELGLKKVQELKTLLKTEGYTNLY